MQVASVSKFTVVADFFNMSKKAAYHSICGDGKDFQVFPQTQVIVQVMKPTNVEILCFEDENLGPKLKLVDRIFIPTAYSIGCSKASADKLVLGCTDGQVKIFNYKTATFQQSLPKEHSNKVFCVDFNSTDELVASVRGIGRVDIYNVNSNVKVNTLVFDSNTLLTRFHPGTCFQLAGASYKGAIYVYDVHASRGIFNAVHAHSSPCSDISMSVLLPQTIISVGIDCILNIFDIRAKQRPTQIKLPNSLSSVAISEDGQYFCVGDMAGKVATFDMRDTSTTLASAQIHKSAVTRVAILPGKSAGSELGASSESGNNNDRKQYHSEPHVAPVTPTETKHGASATPMETKPLDEAGDRARTLKNLLPHFAGRLLLPQANLPKESKENSVKGLSDESFVSNNSNIEEPSTSTTSFGSDFLSSTVHPAELHSAHSMFSIEEAGERMINWEPFGVAPPQDTQPLGYETGKEASVSKPEPEPEADDGENTMKTLIQETAKKMQNHLQRMESNCLEHAETTKKDAMKNSYFTHNCVMDGIDKVRQALCQYELRKAKLQDVLAINKENEKMRKILQDNMHADNQR